MLGLPKLLSEDDVDAEYPSDIDDEYVSEKGFLPTLPGDSTKISSALALFRSSRVLARVLDAVYPHGSYKEGGTRELAYRRLKELEEELEAWMKGLAPHLRLEFVNGVPGTNVVHSRSPLLVCDCNLVDNWSQIERGDRRELCGTRHYNPRVGVRVIRSHTKYRVYHWL